MARLGRLVVVGALPESLVNFRGPLLRACVAAGYEVIALADRPSETIAAQLREMGVEYRWYHVQRNGLSPRSDLRTFLELRRHFRALRPDIVLAYTIKPVVWSGLALRGMARVRYCALVTGLGYAFHGTGARRRWLGRLVELLYRRALRRADMVVFQNDANRQTFIARGLVRPERSAVVNGSGVDLERFRQAPLPAGSPVVLTIARLLGDKGLREYVQAARQIRREYPDVRFQLLGPADPSPDGIAPAELAEWTATGDVEYLGATDDVRPFLQGCHVYVLASYHEGMPRTVLEALAIGRPIVTTTVPGCRDTVVPDTNGRLVPARDAEALAGGIRDMLAERARWPLMASASRRLAEERFDARRVNQEMCRHLGVRSTLPEPLPAGSEGRQ
jgi:glycosyltransferase involved in cell wall biosynthesis